MKITSWVRFPTQGVGFRAEAVIMVVRPAFGGAARRRGRPVGLPAKRALRGSQRLTGHP